MATRLHIKICEAQNILNINFGQTPDPYVTIQLKSQDSKDCVKTQVISNNNNPIWNQEFDIVATDPNDVLLINMYDEDIKEGVKMMNELEFPIYQFQVNGPLERKKIDIKLKKKKAGKFIFEVQAFTESVRNSLGPNKCILKIKAFDAKKVLKMDVGGLSDPYLRFKLKNQQKSVKTTVIYGTRNPIWNQELELICINKNNDILKVDMLDQDISNDDKMMDKIEIPLKDFKNGDVYEFDNDIKLKKKDAGHLHFKIDFIMSDTPSPSLQSQEVQPQNNVNTQKIKDIEEENIRLRASQDQQTKKIKEMEQQEQKIRKIQEEQAQKISKLEKDNSELRSKLQKSNQSNNTNPTGSNSNKLKVAESIWFYQNQNKNIENCFVDDNDEQFHKYIEKVGEGATSITYKIIDTRTNMIMCKKVLKVDPKNPPTMKDVQNIIKEFEVLNQINHPCICTAYYINTQETVKDANIQDSQNTTIAIFLEFLEFDLKKQLQNGMNNTLKTRIIVEISHALNHLHKKGLIHRDLKIENIMLNSVYQAKLVDFGLIRIHECLPEYSYVAESMTKGVGTLAYMSPEMLNEESYDYKTDVYSFGVVLYLMFTGNLPKQSFKDKMKGKKITVTDKSTGISEFCIKLIEKCMASDPDERPTFEEILQELRSNEYDLATSIDKSVVHQRDMELCLFEDK